MSLTVNNNSAAFNVFTNYLSNMREMNSVLGRITTGVKDVVDDAAGVGISERMRAQIRSVAMARTNVENGISMMKTADSWMQKINDVLGRMHELSTEAGGIMTDTDKTNIQSEFRQLQDEITRITSRQSAAGKFNGMYLFRGGNGLATATGDGVQTGSITVQIGAESGQKLKLGLVNLQNTSTDVIGTVSTYTYDSTGTTVTGSTHTQITWGSIIDGSKMSVNVEDAIGMVQTAVDYVSDARATMGAQQARLEQTRAGLLAYEDNLRSAESKIRDVDMARESTEFAKFQILTQVGSAMMSQANQIPAAAVQLLG